MSDLRKSEKDNVFPFLPAFSREEVDATKSHLEMIANQSRFPMKDIYSKECHKAISMLDSLVKDREYLLSQVISSRKAL